MSHTKNCSVMHGQPCSGLVADTFKFSFLLQ